MAEYRYPHADKFKKKHVVMKKGIPVFEGYAATGKPGEVHFSIVCPDKESCEEIWNHFMDVDLDHGGIANVVLCRTSDIEMDVTPAKLRMVKS